jgi:hypothetical protein
MKSFFLDDTGLELSQYAIAAALAAISVAGAFTSFCDAIVVSLNELLGRANG